MTMPTKTGYDITKAPNVAPRINRKCGAAIVRALDFFFDDPDNPTIEELTDEEKKDVAAFLKNLRGNVVYWQNKRKGLP